MTNKGEAKEGLLVFVGIRVCHQIFRTFT